MTLEYPTSDIVLGLKVNVMVRVSSNTAWVRTLWVPTSFLFTFVTMKYFGEKNSKRHIVEAQQTLPTQAIAFEWKPGFSRRARLPNCCCYSNWTGTATVWRWKEHSRWQIDGFSADAPPPRTVGVNHNQSTNTQTHIPGWLFSALCSPNTRSLRQFLSTLAFLFH